MKCRCNFARLTARKASRKAERKTKNKKNKKNKKKLTAGRGSRSFGARTPAALRVAVMSLSTIAGLAMSVKLVTQMEPRLTTTKP